MKVLLIDDNTVYLNGMCGLLEEEGFEVLRATTGLEGVNLTLIHEKEIAVVFCDWEMPAGGGDFFLQNHGLFNAKIFIVSGMKFSSQQIHWIKAQGATVITKSFDTPDYIVELCQKWVPKLKDKEAKSIPQKPEPNSPDTA
jgi:CheY-like chemotaxis protein